jgi:3-hydroxyisobutyrate dehydrogenase-like beta-hydroxyacid dehydrogenase
LRKEKDAVKKKKIGFIGLGNMGKQMSGNLLKAGYEVTVFDIRQDAIKDMVAQGAKGAGSLKELGALCDVVFVMVLNFKQVQPVTIGEEGVISGMNPGSVLIVTSTIAPSETLSIAEYAKKRGVEFIDSPVSGGVIGATEGTLVMMSAAKADVFENCKDILLAVGKNTISVSDKIGMGQAVKAINQLLVSVHVVVTGEALVLSQKVGIDPDLLFDVIGKSVGVSYMFNLKTPKILDRNWENAGALDIQIKDLDICLKMGREHDVPLFLSAISRELFLMAEGMGCGREDCCAVTKVYEKAAQIEVKHLKK